jgi:hypothetical protein
MIINKNFSAKSILTIALLYCNTFYFATKGFSQKIDRIDLSNINQRQVREYIKSRSIDRMDDFSLIHTSWKKGLKESEFHTDRRTFYLNRNLSDVWNGYRHANLIKSWSRHYIRFGLLIAKNSNSVVYTKTLLYPDLDTGQVYFLNLRILKGLLHVPVAFEIINIDPVAQKMEFSYLDDNKSLGKQTLQFFNDGDGRTKIVHTSLFRSNSRLRDALLYPYFHHKFIREFHRSIRLQVNKI